MKKFFSCFVLIISFCFSHNLFAKNFFVDHIYIEGNQRVEDSLIISYLQINKGDPFSQSKLDSALRNLHNTGLFKEISFEIKKNNIIVKVKENPIVNRVTFEGNNRVKTEDIKKEILTRSRTVFSKNKLQRDVKRILAIYSKEGRFATKVDPKMIKQEDNRVDVVFEIDEGPKTPIKTINFIGNNIYKSSKLKSIIVTKEQAWYRFLSTSHLYDPDRIEYDKELLRRFYTSMGYADFKVVAVTSDLTSQRDGFIMTFALEEGKRYNYGEINLDLQIETMEPKTLLDAVITEEGKLYNAENIEKSISNLQKILSDNGYAFVSIEPRLSRNREEGTIAIDYVIQESQKIYINKINIEGNARTQDKVIRREFRLSEGDPFNATNLKRSEQRVRDLNFFDKVTVTSNKTAEPDKIDIDMEVIEKTTGDINFGAGYSSTDGMLGRIGIKEKNFVGTGKEISLNYERAQKRQNIDLGFTDPYFLDYDLSFGFDAYNIAKDNKQASSYTSETNGLRLRFGYNVTEFLRHHFFYSLNNTNIKNVLTASRSIQEQSGRTLSNGVGHSFVYDRRNSAVFPTDGYFFRFAQDATGLIGDSNTFANDIKASIYYPLSEKKDIVFRTSFSGGHIVGHSNRGKKGIRIFERYFLGGDDIKGFKNAGIGPRDATGNRDALGGNTYYLFNAELNFPIGLPDELDVSGSIFFDAGGLFGLDDKSTGIIGKYDGIRMSSGVGVVWITKVGPLRLDWAYPIVKYSYDRTQSFRISFSTGF